MKFESRTIQILKNFANINKSIQFKPGHELKTVAPSRFILASAKIKEEITAEFCLFELGKLLSAIAEFLDPELTPTKNKLVVGPKDHNINLVYSNPDNIDLPPEKDIDFKEDFKFSLTQDKFASIQKELSFLALPDFVITGDGKTLMIKGTDIKNPTSDTIDVKIGPSKVKCNMILKAENMVIIPDDYTISISSKRIVRFVSKDLTYFVVCDQSSVYGEGE